MFFFYHQCLTVHPGAGGDTDGSESDDSFKTAVLGPVLEEPSHEPQTEKVSSGVVY